MIEFPFKRRDSTALLSDIVSSRSIHRQGFTLLEMLVAITVLLLMVVLVLGIVTHVGHTWERLQGQKVRQQTARQVFEIMSRDLQTAIFPLDVSNLESFQFLLNSPGLEAYQNPSSAFWQASSVGQTSLGDVFEVGYFVSWSTTGIHSEIRRFYLPPNQSAIFDTPEDWINADIIRQFAPGSDDANSQRGLLAENVIGLWILLYNRQGVQISAPYDSRKDLATSDRHVASAVIQLAIIDSPTLARLTDKSRITSHYTAADADTFAAALPSEIKAGVEVFKTSVRLEASPQ